MIKRLLYKCIDLFCKEWYITQSERRRFTIEARTCFDAEKPEHGSMKEYQYCLRKYRVTYSEYMHQYEFWKLKDAERKEFVSRSEMQKIYRKFIMNPDVRALMIDKPAFLIRFADYIQRKWMLVREHSFDEFKQLTDVSDCIAKPKDGSLGHGIVKILKGSATEDLYAQCQSDNVLLEECVRAEQTIEAFNPDTLNTIRVVTFSNGKEAEVFGAFIRFGRKGRIVDNAHNGGIFAQINVETGIIESNGINTDGDEFICHPDSKKQFKGFPIPQWNEIKDFCCRAALEIKELRVCGWDVCVRQNGKLEFIEGNHAPDFDVMQSPLKKGVRAQLNSVFTRLYGMTI